MHSSEIHRYKQCGHVIEDLHDVECPECKRLSKETVNALRPPAIRTKYPIPAVVATLRNIVVSDSESADPIYVEHLNYAADILEQFKTAIEAAHDFAAKAQAEGRRLTPTMKKLLGQVMP